MKKTHFSRFFSRRDAARGGSCGKGKGIQKKLVLRIEAITVCVSLVLGGISIAAMYFNSKSSMDEDVTALSQSYSRAVSEELAKYRLSAEAVARNDYITDMSHSLEERKSYLASLAKQYGFKDIEVSNAKGSTYGGADISKEEYFRQAMDGSTYISSASLRGSDSSVIMIAAAKINNSTNYRGVVACAMDAAQFNQTVGSISVGKSGYGFVLDKSGTVVADKRFDNVRSTVNYISAFQKDASLAGAADLSRQMTAGKTGSDDVALQGRRAHVGYLPVSGTAGWSLGIVAYNDEMMQSMFAVAWAIVALMAVFLVLSLLVANRLSKPIVQPMLELMKRLESLAKGDLHSRVPQFRTGDEVEKLSVAFAGTVDALNDYIGEISSVLGSMAEGDFTARPVQDYKGDFVAIRNALDSILESMNGMLGRISVTAGQVAGGSRQMAGASQELAEGASRQTGTILELSGAVERIARQAEASSQNASLADQISGHAMEQVSVGAERMERMFAAMEKISESSGRIEKIIKTVQDIAFQTNILALNAAVEAARAGEAGRGFAVVADEVRNLANRSSEAVKNTSVLIRESLAAVQDGRKTADETAQYLKAIVGEVEQMSGLLRSIAAAAGEQASSVRGVNGNVEQISSVIRQNSATAEKSAATSEELSSLSASLSAMLARFRLSQAGREQEEDGKVIPLTTA